MTRRAATITEWLAALVSAAIALHGCSTEIYEADVRQVNYLDLGGDWGPGGDGGPPPWWDTAYGYRRQLTITAAERLPALYLMELSFDHAAWVSAGTSRSDGNDVRVLFWDGSSWAERGRFTAVAWNSNNTAIRFSTAAAIPAGTDTRHWIYYGNNAAGAPPSDPTAIFSYYSDFSSGTRFASNWSLYDTGGGSAPDYRINGGQLYKGGSSSAGGATPGIADKVVLTGSTPGVGFRTLFTVSASASGGFIGAGLCSGDGNTANDFYIGLTRAGTSLDGAPITTLPAASYWLGGSAGNTGISDDLSTQHVVALEWTTTAMRVWVRPTATNDPRRSEWSTGPTASGFFCIVGNNLADIGITELFLRPFVDSQPQIALGTPESH